MIELIAEKYRLSLKEARDLLFNSDVIKLIEDDETGLYYQSAGYVYSFLSNELKTAIVA